MQLRELTDRVALITGASSGIGEAAARALVAENVRVVLVARSREKIETLASELGERALAVPTDVGDPAQVEQLFATIRQHFDGLDLVFNNAGVGYNGAFEQSDPEEWRKTIDANLYGVLYCTQQAIPLLRGREGAMISTVSSVGGRYGVPGWSVYCATKFAVVGFHDTLRKELGSEGIRVSLIEPGAVYTNWGYNVSEAAMKERRDKVDALHADDIANALVYAFAQPGHVNPQELLIMPTKQVSP
ncbi:SDR family oxidoreductase [Kushneria phosphatilytica]|uniref:sulfoacetaldehyde reductase (NADPH) n=1 Tax=Kushneria phosphatilytica TaxID=657387 RepID=A0A1S1NQG5_9GAMM|nr:SDR family oxidoreductase [Kushneria phosphatilytica]OHV10859.1 oxidoreductase [Kushneria phosphatilytica]QEL12057.1 SDR family oxidoreductase [Kushneria phosphatilytica]